LKYIPTRQYRSKRVPIVRVSIARSHVAITSTSVAQVRVSTCDQHQPIVRWHLDLINYLFIYLYSVKLRSIGVWFARSANDILCMRGNCLSLTIDFSVFNYIAVFYNFCIIQCFIIIIEIDKTKIPAQMGVHVWVNETQICDKYVGGL
jgi:hypothetical protein